MLKEAKERFNPEILQLQSNLLDGVNISLPGDLNPYLTPVVYTEYTDNRHEVMEVFAKIAQERGEEWSGHVITTLGAGWPLEFFQHGAKRCTVVEINFLQVLDFLHRFQEVGELEDIKEELTDSLFLVENVNDLTMKFWKKAITGDEIIWLSNIGDHCLDYGQFESFLAMLRRILDSVKPGKRVDIVLSCRSYHVYSGIIDRAFKRLFYSLKYKKAKDYKVTLSHNEEMSTASDTYAMHTLGVITIDRTATAEA